MLLGMFTPRPVWRKPLKIQNHSDFIAAQIRLWNFLPSLTDLNFNAASKSDVDFLMAAALLVSKWCPEHNSIYLTKIGKPWKKFLEQDVDEIVLPQELLVSVLLALITGSIKFRPTTTRPGETLLAYRWSSLARAGQLRQVINQLKGMRWRQKLLLLLHCFFSMHWHVNQPRAPLPQLWVIYSK